MHRMVLATAALMMVVLPITTIGADAASKHKSSMSGPIKCQADTMTGPVNWSCQRNQKCCYDFWSNRTFCAAKTAPECNN